MNRKKVWDLIRQLGAPTVLGFISVYSWLRSSGESFWYKLFEAARQQGIEIEQAATLVFTRVKEAAEYTNLTHLAKANCKSHLNYNVDMYKKAVLEQEQSAKELQTLISSNDPNIIRSDISEYLVNLVNLVDNIKDYIYIFSPEQFIILFNLSGYTLLGMTMTSITLMIIGQELINSFQLELKYPRFAEYIKFQLTLRKLYLSFYIVYFYLLIIILISVNIFMFFYAYI